MTRKVKLIGIAPCYNESSNGHLDRFLINIPKVVDGLVLLDDASTDDSLEKMREATPHVLVNKKNMFVFEQKNTKLLIDKALEVYPDLTHILTLNIDSTFAPCCFKDGDALIHKCISEHTDVGMWKAKNLHLWRSPYWYRCDHGPGMDWDEDYAERVYVREHGLELLNINKPGLHHGKMTRTNNQRNINEFYPEVLSLHWGFISRKHIADKFHYYMRTERVPVPIPSRYRCTNNYKNLDEFDLEVAQVKKEWMDPDVPLLPDKGKPLSLSYYSDIVKYDRVQAERYLDHFLKKVGHTLETERFEQ